MGRSSIIKTMALLKDRYLSWMEKVPSRQLGIIIFKPGYSAKMIASFHEFCKKNGLAIAGQTKKKLSRGDVVALYPKIFSFSRQDLTYGVAWKKKTIEYPTSGPSLFLFAEGKNASGKVARFKAFLRNDHGKISHPEKKMSDKEFFDKVVKNIVHGVDEREVHNALWLLAS